MHTLFKISVKRTSHAYMQLDLYAYTINGALTQDVNKCEKKALKKSFPSERLITLQYETSPYKV